jgi:hypothetical protein
LVGVVGSWLSGVGCYLSVSAFGGSCWLLVVRCWSLIVGVTVCGCFWLLVVRCWLLIAVSAVGGCCWLLVVRCWLLTDSDTDN